jgi:hypothetical protein
VLTDHLQRRSRGAAGTGAGNGQFVGGAGVPAHPDPHGLRVRLGQQGAIGDQATQQPLAVAGAGGLGVPQPGGSCARACNESVAGKAGSAACAVASAASASVSAASRASDRDSSARVTKRFSGSTLLTDLEEACRFGEGVLPELRRRRLAAPGRCSGLAPAAIPFAGMLLIR